MRRHAAIFLLGSAAGLWCGAPAVAKVSLPAIFGDHMVLQQGRPLPVWGWADPGEPVRVAWNQEERSTVTDAEGNWRVELPPLAGSTAPGTLRVAGSNEVLFTDVVVGDVWLCSGQSNMFFQLQQAEGGAAAIATADHPALRLFLVPRRVAWTRQQDLAGVRRATEGRWVVCRPDDPAVAEFSAVGFFFGRQLHAARGQPVGLISAAYGGSPAEAWMSESALAADERLLHFARRYVYMCSNKGACTPVHFPVPAMVTACVESLPLYRPRDPKASDLWRLLDEHFDSFQQVYDERYQEKYGYWRTIIEQSVAAFLKCGDLQEGFARVRCPDCKHEMFVAFSCKQRCTCPSCHQKRTLLTSLHVAEEVCSPVAHRQVVLTIPKRLRVHTRFDRQLLGTLSSCAWSCLKAEARRLLGRDDVVPGMIGAIQTHGQLLHWHPHLHVLITCRAFPDPKGDGMRAGVPRNFQILEPLDFLAEFTQHIPPKGSHLIRYYGWYSNKSRGMRKKAEAEAEADTSAEASSEESASAAVASRCSQTWAMLIKRVYEVDPLSCPECGGQMKVVSFIEPRAPSRSDGRADVIEAILKHCGLWQPRSPRAPPDVDELVLELDAAFCRQLARISGPSGRVPGADLRRH